MPHFICTACGTQYAQSDRAPARCLICEEERQYVPPRGQTWTTLEALRGSHSNTFREYEKGIIGLGATPAFAIGQRALLLRTPSGNILWDCIATLDDATVTMIEHRRTAGSAVLRPFLDLFARPAWRGLSSTQRTDRSCRPARSHSA
jgi:hypothetical protein